MFYKGLGHALRISLVMWVMMFVAVAYVRAEEVLQVNSGGDYTITEVPVEVIEGEIIDLNIKKYDITRFKHIKDVNDVLFTIIDKVERLDLHQLNYDNAQEQKSIEQMTASIAELQDKITKRNLMIENIKKIAPVEKDPIIK